MIHPDTLLELVSSDDAKSFFDLVDQSDLDSMEELRDDLQEAFSELYAEFETYKRNNEVLI